MLKLSRRRTALHAARFRVVETKEAIGQHDGANGRVLDIDHRVLVRPAQHFFLVAFFSEFYFEDQRGYNERAAEK